MHVRWTRPALIDLDEIQTYVARESPAAAHKLVHDLFDRTQNGLAVSPDMGRLGRYEIRGNWFSPTCSTSWPTASLMWWRFLRWFTPRESGPSRSIEAHKEEGV